METNVFHMGALIRMAFWTTLLVFARHMARAAVGREQAEHTKPQGHASQRRRKPPQEHPMPSSEELRKLMTYCRLTSYYFSKKDD